jgi:hypothetical protein
MAFYVGSLKTDFDVEGGGRALRNHSQHHVCLSKHPMNFMIPMFRVFCEVLVLLLSHL